MRASILIILSLLTQSSFAHGGGGHGGSGGHGWGHGGSGGSHSCSFHVGGGSHILGCNDPGFYHNGFANPNFDADFWFQQGATAQGNDNYNDAIDDYTKAIQMDSTDAESLNYRGMAYCQVDEPYKAIMDFDQVIKLNPKSASAYNNRGAVFENLGMMAASVKDYQRACELDEWSMKYRRNLREAQEKYNSK